MNGIYCIPLFAVIIVGMLSKRTPSIAAKVGLAIGFTIIPFCYFVPFGKELVSGMNSFNFLGIAFLIIVAAMLLIRLIKPLTTDFVQEDVGAVDMTPWKHGKKVGIILCVAVVAIYAVFANSEAFTKDHNNPEGKKKFDADQATEKSRKER